MHYLYRTLIAAIFLILEQASANSAQDVIFIHRHQNYGSHQFLIGVEMPPDRSSLTLIWDDQIYHFNKPVQLLEIPSDASNMLAKLGPFPFQIQLNHTNQFMIVFADGEVVNFTEFPSPYRFKIPELAGSNRFRIFRQRLSLNDQFTFLENKERQLFYGFNVNTSYRLNRSVEEAPKHLIANGEWSSILDEKQETVIEMTQLSWENEPKLIGRPMSPAELSDWNSRLKENRYSDQVTIRDSNWKLGIAGSPTPYPVIFRMKDSRYLVVRMDEKRLAIIDSETDGGATVKTVVLQAPKFSIEETVGSLLIYYPDIHETDVFAKETFENRKTLEFCAQELLGWKLTNPKEWSRKAPKKRNRR